MKTSRPPAMLLVAVLAAPSLAIATSAHAAVIAKFTVHSIEGGGFVDDQDPFPHGDPDRYFTLGIFDSTDASVLTACAVACTGDGDPSTLDASTFTFATPNTGTGLWDFPDQILSKVIPDGGGAFFYFGLWDADPDDDDSLGDHWLFADTPTSSTVLNNNLSPFFAGSPIVSVAGNAVEGIGDANNYRLSYSISFEQTTPAPEPTSLVLASAVLAGLIARKR